MSVDQIPTRQPPRRPDDAKLVRYEDFIESKIQSTRWMVKAVDLATALVTLVASLLAFLLVVAMAEHWIVPGGFSVAARTSLFTVLVIGIGYFSYHRVWPLLVRAINPVYAARAIEQGSPTLKNSLINLLFFRERRAGISDAVYRTLEEQAAQRLTRVPVETPVDRSVLIRLGYVLVGVVALAGLYKVFSPKDPLVSAERILLPWADIVPASRVTISAVTPGSLTVSRGEFVDVAAEVHGLGDDDAMVLRYTTDDGQVVGKAIPMKPAGDGLRYACRVADEADGSEPIGLTRSLKYRLEAGDARSLDYAIKVVSAPSILVEHVDYHYPPYTGYIDRTVDGLGDIRAIEGTRMTIHARANGAIRVADVDFDADGRPDLRMKAKETGADASFELSLREDRQTPRHASYVLRFTNEEDRANHDPVKHSIAVDRDQDPEAGVLSPKEKSIDARMDETVAIEVEAIDPDFKLSAVRLHGEAAGQSVLDELLLKAEHKGRFTARYLFVPNAHGLKAGDTLKYWVEAGDNRTPKPNTVTTAKEERTIRIVSPNPAQQPPPDRVARNDRQQPKPGANQQGGQKEQGGQQGEKDQGEKSQGGAAGQNDQANQKQGGDAGGQKQPGENPGEQKGEKQQGGGQGNKSGEQNADKQQQQSKGDSKSGGEGKAENKQGGDQKGNEQKDGENGQGGSQSKSGERGGKDSSGQQQSKGEQTGAGASGGQQSKDAARPDGARPDQGDKAQQPNDGQQQGGQKNDEQQKGKKQTQPEDQKTAVSSEGDNDGEAFERIQKRMEQSGELKKEGEQSEGEKGREGEGEKAQQKSAKDKVEGEGKSANGESASADGKSGEKPSDASQKQQPGEQGKDQKQDAGAKPNGDDAQQNKEQKSDGVGEQKKSPEGQEVGSTGPGGAGEEKQSQGSPNSQPDKKPVEKHQQSGSKEGTNKEEPPAGANGKKESDSSGDQGGDKAGGGEEGAGQKAPREGTGSAGDHQSADNGTGESAEKGKGDKSSSGGKDAKSDHTTGSSDGKTPGEGSQQKDGSGNKQGGSSGGENAESRDGKNAAGEKGDKAGSKEGEATGTQSKAEQEGKQAGKQQEKNGKDVGKQGDQKGGDAGKKKDGGEKGKSGGQQEGGGLPGGVVNPQPNSTGSAPEGDAANLEYARKQTDLVLDKLSDQLNKNKVDDRMLKELGWTRDDLRRFVERWQQRKDAAQRDDPKGEAAKRELDDALRSLGLQREKLQQNGVQKDSMRDLKQGYRGPVPLEYQERLRAYNQGVSRAHRDGE